MQCMANHPQTPLQVIIMKLRISTFCFLLAATSTAASAQEGAQERTATYPTADGKLVVHSSQPGPQPSGPPPAFAQLDRHGAGFLNPDDAAGYPLLANDFIYADSNRDGRISKAEYARWARSR
jgi:hypothetical protein